MIADAGGVTDGILGRRAVKPAKRLNVEVAHWWLHPLTIAVFVNTMFEKVYCDGVVVHHDLMSVVKGWPPLDEVHEHGEPDK